MENFTAYFVDIELSENISEATAVVNNIPCLPTIGTDILINNHQYRVLNIDWIIETEKLHIAYVKIRIMRPPGT